MKPTFYTLITGASAGIGKALAYEAARRGQNLVLVALTDSRLELVAASIKLQYQVQVHFIEVDLCEKDAALEVYETCKVNRWHVNALINNAGVGAEGAFAQENESHILSLLMLNITSLTMITRYFLPEMVERESGYILNMSSFAGILPFPFKAAYGASKSYVLSFSQALREELKNTPIKVCVVCPGGVITNAEVLARIKTKGIIARLNCLLPRDVARNAFHGLDRNKDMVIPGTFNKFIYLLAIVLPKRARLFLVSNIFGKTHKNWFKTRKEKIY